MKNIVIFHVIVMIIEAIVIYKFLSSRLSNKAEKITQDLLVEDVSLFQTRPLNIVPSPLTVLPTQPLNAAPSPVIVIPKQNVNIVPLPKALTPGADVNETHIQREPEGKNIKPGLHLGSFKEITEEADLNAILNQESRSTEAFVFYSKFNPFSLNKLSNYSVYHTLYRTHEDPKTQFPRELIVKDPTLKFHNLTDAPTPQSVFYKIDCGQLFKVCWKYQLNHHPLPLLLLFVPSKSYSETSLYHMGKSREEELFPTFSDFNFSSTSTPPLKEKLPPSLSHPEPESSLSSKHEFSSLTKYPSATKISSTSLDLPQTTATSFTRNDFPPGRYLFLDSPLIHEVSHHQALDLLMEASPSNPKIVFIYSDLSDLSINFVKQFIKISQKVTHYLSIHNHKRQRKRKGFNSHHHNEGFIPNVMFYALNYHYFADSKLFSLLQISENFIPIIVSLHFHIIKEKIGESRIGHWKADSKHGE